MDNYKLIISYNGTRFFGWQDNGKDLSIEGTLNSALKRIYGKKLKLQAASRTDRGVHAKGQVVNFFAPPLISLPILVKAINRYLPKDIRVLSAEIKGESFHPTLDCLHKEYVYRICNQPIQMPFDRDFSWHVKPPLDLNLMRNAAQLLCGEKDFGALTNQSPSVPFDKTRKLDSIDVEDGVAIVVRGQNFLYKMVRNIVGLLVHVGLQKINLKDVQKILDGCDRKEAGQTAPAHGLTLNKVFYDFEK